MKIRILSDIHNDINRGVRLKPSSTFTIVAGDISGNEKETIKWVKDNLTNGVFIEGNHIGYNTNTPLQDIDKLYRETFPNDSYVAYLNNAYKIVDDIVFVGGTMFTNYMLNGEAFKVTNMQLALKGLNDFNYNRFRDGDEIRTVTPNDYIKLFDETLGVIKSTCEQFPDKKIVVVTHHAPSPKSIGQRYVNDDTNASYANNLEEFILEHPNIKLWVHGHIHSCSDYKIGECRVVCNPMGYSYYEPNYQFDENFSVFI